MIKKWVTRTLAASFFNNKKIKDIRSPMAFLSIASVVVGVATLVVAVSIMSGFKALLLNSFLNFSGHIDIYPSWDRGGTKKLDMVLRDNYFRKKGVIDDKYKKKTLSNI